MAPESGEMLATSLPCSLHGSLTFEIAVKHVVSSVKPLASVAESAAAFLTCKLSGIHQCRHSAVRIFTAGHHGISRSLIRRKPSMDAFPRTNVGGVSLSRMIIGTNWFLGWSHTSSAKDAYIHEHVQDRGKIANILEIFFREGVDTIMGQISCPPLADAIKDAEDRTGVGCKIISTPGFPVAPKTLETGFDRTEVAHILDQEKRLGALFCMPHQSTTDMLVDRCSRKIRCMDSLCAMIRERGMIPGLSTHMPESIIYADESGLDVGTYVAIYNSMGFLMQIEVDWIAKVIHDAKKPVMTIKPMAAGQIRPFQALHFVWNTIRQIDMVTVGTMSLREAAECIELSRSILERRDAGIALQETRSKASVKARR
jgi:hypothetical protein